MNQKIGIYVRVSTSEQSCELQQRELLEYCKARGFDNTTLYADEGFTGTNANRPEFRHLMSDARARKIDIVLVWKLDRFGRSLKDLVLNLDELTHLGVAFISLKDQIDLTTSIGRLIANMLGSFAAFEADLIKERVRAGLRNARANGKTLGRPKTTDDLKVLDLRNKGRTLSQIATELGMSKSGVHKSLFRKAQ